MVTSTKSLLIMSVNELV